jgi:hypothetical protein
MSRYDKSGDYTVNDAVYWILLLNVCVCISTQ